ncbi:hypothetical protein K7G98_11525 [Saccharothrix sp. MB29]|nr:hypothetical protein [Saccharothrix sp. MB29]
MSRIRGRADQQVKIRGFRIEPGETESVQHPAVRQVVVVAKQHRLVAYCVPDKPTTVSTVHTASVLPDYMVPRCCRTGKSLQRQR